MTAIFFIKFFFWLPLRSLFFIIFCSDIIFFGVVASFVAFVFFIINIFPIILPIRSSQTQTSRASIFFHSHFHNSDRLQIFAHTNHQQYAGYLLLTVYLLQAAACLFAFTLPHQLPNPIFSIGISVRILIFLACSGFLFPFKTAWPIWIINYNLIYLMQDLMNYMNN